MMNERTIAWIQDKSIESPDKDSDVVIQTSMRISCPVVAESSFTFVGPVTFQDEVNVIKPINCHACNKEQVPGFTWDSRSICMNCIYDSCMQFRAKESWAEKNGDPMRNCLDMIKTLQEELKQYKEEIAKLQKKPISFEMGEHLSQYL